MSGVCRGPGQANDKCDFVFVCVFVWVATAGAELYRVTVSFGTAVCLYCVDCVEVNDAALCNIFGKIRAGDVHKLKYHQGKTSCLVVCIITIKSQSQTDQ